MYRFFNKVNSDSKFTLTLPLIKQPVTTDKNSWDDKVTNKKQQSVNRFLATKNPDYIKYLKSHPPKENWYRFDSKDIKATEIIQTWK